MGRLEPQIKLTYIHAWLWTGEEAGLVEENPCEVEENMQTQKLVAVVFIFYAPAHSEA